MGKALLLEIGTEELPSSFVDAALAALPGLARTKLEALRLTHGNVRALGTPRRLALLVDDVAEKQPDLDEEVIGPPESAAYKDGKPTKAAEAFATKLGISLDELSVVERAASGKGQVVDAAMVDGAAMLAAPFFGFLASGFWQDRRGENLLDSGCPFYDTYETADGRHVAVACLEPQFFAEFARLLPLEQRFATSQYDRALWPQMRAANAARLAERTRDESTGVFAGTDACVAPVLSLTEAPASEHARARKAHVSVGDMVRPRPAPRFSRSQPGTSGPALDDVAVTLARFGIGADECEALATAGVVAR